MSEKLNRLVASLEKSETKVEKIKNTIERNFKLLDKKIAVVAELGYTVTYNHLEFGVFSGVFTKSYEDMEQQKWDENRKDGDYWALCEVFSKLDDINTNHQKLAEAEKIVSNWKEKIVKEQDNLKINESAPQIIIDFVDAWGEMAFDWHMKNARHPNEELIRKLIESEKEYKVRDLVYRVENVTGKITDAKYLSVGEKGDLTGYIVGEDGRAWVETISAGGWNIQCFHFRTIVSKA